MPADSSVATGSSVVVCGGLLSGGVDEVAEREVDVTEVETPVRGK
jgi:hypothetical protein